MRNQNNKKSSNNKRFEKTNIAKIIATTFMKMIVQNKNQIIFIWFEHFEMLNKFKKKNKYILINFFAINITIIFVENFEKFFIKVDKISLIEKQLKNKFFSKFHKYVKTWNLVETNKFFSRKKWSYLIDFKSKSTFSIKKIYDLSRDQVLVIKKYVNNMLNKNFIKFNSFEYATFVLIIKKFENDLKICVNYKTFNVFTIKNRNASSFIKKTLIKFCFTKIYSKFNIIIVFNEMRIKKKNEKKNNFLNALWIIEIRRYVVRIMQCFWHVLNIYQRNIARIFERFLYRIFEWRIDIQQK